MSMDSLHSLFEDEIKDLYSAENQLLKALPKMAKKASSAKLKEAFTSHLAETKTHVERLEQIGKLLEFKLTGKTCQAMKGLVAEGDEVIEEDGEAAVLDAALIGAAQRVEHYEIAAYGVTRSMAEIMGHREAVKLLDQTIKEEGVADKKLTQIAENGVLRDAAAANDEEDMGDK